MKSGSLFAGYGGLDLATRDALGATTAWVAETDAAASAVLTHRFPGTPNHGDVTAIDWAAAEPVPVLKAGYPCQGESDAGNRLGDRDPRWMWPAYRAAIATIRPRLAIGENVRAHIGRSFRHVIADLQTLGYAVAWVVVSAADVGACHLRERVFWLAWPQEHGPPAGLGRHPFAHLENGVMVTDDLFGGAPCMTWPTAGAAYAGAAYAGAAYAGAAPELGLLPTVRTSDTNGAGSHGDGGLDLRTAVSLLPTPSAQLAHSSQTRRGGSRSGELLLDGIVQAVATGQLASAVELLPTPDARHQRKQTRTGPLLAGAVELMPTVTAADSDRTSAEYPRGNPTLCGAVQLMPTPRATDGATDGPTERWGPYAATVARWEALTRPAPDPTVPGKNGKPSLNPAFAEWLMGAPEGWITDVPGITRTQALKLAGNGVVRQQGAAAITWLAARLPAGVIPEPEGTRVPA